MKYYLFVICILYIEFYTFILSEIAFSDTIDEIKTKFRIRSIPPFNLSVKNYITGPLQTTISKMNKPEGGFNISLPINFRI